MNHLNLFIFLVMVLVNHYLAFQYFATVYYSFTEVSKIDLCHALPLSSFLLIIVYEIYFRDIHHIKLTKFNSICQLPNKTLAKLNSSFAKKKKLEEMGINVGVKEEKWGLEILVNFHNFHI